jgi:hypothetical protein
MWTQLSPALPRRLDGKQTAMPQLQETPSSYLIMLMIIFLLLFALPLDLDFV